MGKERSNISYRDSYDVEASRHISSMTCFDRFITKCTSKCCMIIGCIICAIITFTIVAAIIIGAIVITYEVTNDDTKTCNVINIFDNIYIGKENSLNEYCVGKYNLTKIFTIDDTITKYSDCKFDIKNDEDQLILNKLTDTSSIIKNWTVDQNNVLICDNKGKNSVPIVFAYMLSINYSYEDANKILTDAIQTSINILNSDIMIYNFYQQIKLFALSISKQLDVDIIMPYDEQILLWSNYNNNITCYNVIE